MSDKSKEDKTVPFLGNKGLFEGFITVYVLALICVIICVTSYLIIDNMIDLIKFLEGKY